MTQRLSVFLRSVRGMLLRVGPHVRGRRGSPGAWASLTAENADPMVEIEAGD